MTIDELQFINRNTQLKWNPPDWLKGSQGYPELKDRDNISVTFEVIEAIPFDPFGDEKTEEPEEQLFALVVDEQGLKYHAAPSELEIL